MSWIVSLIVNGLMAISLSTTTPIDNQQRQSPPSPTADISATNVATLLGSSQQQDRIDQTYPLNANGKVSLNTVNGTIVIEAWDKSEARVEAVKKIDCDRPYQIDVNIDSNPNSLQIETEYPRENYGRNWSNNNHCREARVDYKLTLPRGARLDQIETVNGNITLGGMNDLVRASTVNGTINASNLRGTINLSSVNGTLAADFASLENVREVKIGMVNGKIDLQLPSDAEATLKADTVNGSIRNDFGLPVRKGEYVGRNLYGRLGNGGINVKLDGVNGTINVRRKQDGRSLKQVTNLLPPKGKDSDDDDDMDNDEDGDNGASARPPRAPRAPRAPRPPRAAPGAGIGDAVIEGINEGLNDITREQIQQALDLAKSASQLDQKELKLQIREGLEDARREMEDARAQQLLSQAFNFRFNTGRSSFASMSERETKSIAVEGKPRVTVDAYGGRVSIRGWDRAEVSYAVMRLAANVNESAKAVVTFDKKGSEINLSVPKGAANYRLEIFVPRNSNLRITSSEQIRVENVKGELKLDGGNESIDIRDAGGDLSVLANDARVRVIGFDGNTIIKTINGDIALEGDFSSLVTDTEGGTTALVLNDATTAEIQSSTKNISFDGINFSASSANNASVNTWRVGGKEPTAKKYSLKTGAGKIVIRSLNSVRVTRKNQFRFNQSGEIYS